MVDGPLFRRILHCFFVRCGAVIEKKKGHRSVPLKGIPNLGSSYCTETLAGGAGTFSAEPAPITTGNPFAFTSPFASVTYR